jgi:hypothetical protein
MQLTAFGTRNSTSCDFKNIDSSCSLLTGSPTLRNLILGMKTRPRPPVKAGTEAPTPGPLFLSVDPATWYSDHGSLLVTYTIDNAVEAEGKLKNLLSHLLQAHGKSATYWFNPTAIELVDNMLWDKVNDRPIIIEESELDKLLNDDLDWVANMDLADISFKSTVKVSLE